jgi:tRNA A37 methylthiotransferase MiaB
MKKKKVILFGSVPMSLSELQLAPAIIGAYVKRRGHVFSYHDINLKLFDYCNKNQTEYSNHSEFLQDYNKYHESTQIIDCWQEHIVDTVMSADIVLINVFSVFSQVPALRVINLCKTHAPDAKIIIGGIGSHKQILSGVNQFNRWWVDKYFPHQKSKIFGNLCLDNNYIDDWQSTVELDSLDKWLPTHPIVSYNKTVDFVDYQLDHYRWQNNKKQIPMLGSHGCVRQCSFCDVITHFPRYSFIEADTLTKSIVETYQQTGISKIQFMDSLVNGSTKNFLNLLKNLAQAKQKKWLPDDFSWSGTYICRPQSTVLDEIHNYLPQSGVDNLIIGVETGSDRIRYEMEKKFLNKDLLYELSAFEKYKTKASALFFPSWPTETDSDFAETLNLFEQLSRYAQTNTLQSVNLGTSGFTLLDGTPIDRDREKFGLEQGPRPWLWKCNTNPNLTFWETIRRRLLMAEWCEMYGIPLAQESVFRRYLAFNLAQNQDLILSYSGTLITPIDVCQFLPKTTHHKLQFNMINNHTDLVKITISIGSHSQTYECMPGTNYFVFEFVRNLSKQETLCVSSEFSNNHRTQWAQFDSKDYYDQQGIYIDKILLDHCDITYWGWNHSVTTHWRSNKILPIDYVHHENKRCLTSDMDLFMEMSKYHSPHKHIANCREPEISQERQFADKHLYKQLNLFL